ncbi:MAG: patatin-like phospholipase family protein [Acidimicrobiales bacterium]|nr:patatin-like phospholipase family protein [Acidimicrobiales bacterium]
MGDPRVGFVLAGGGTKGAFEVGALRYLVGEAALVPEVVTAASAGAIVGSKLAQARTLDELRPQVAELRADLLAMTDIDVVFGRQPWLADLADTDLGRALDAFLEVRPAPPPGVDPTPSAAASGAAAPSPAASGAAASGAAASGGSGPGARPHRRHHWRRRLHALHEAIVSVPELRRALDDLPDHASSFLTLDPLEEALRHGGGGIAALDPQRVARPGVELRLAVTALREGATRYVTGTGLLVEDDAVTPVSTASGPVGPVDLVEAVLTSSSAPIVFPPRLVAGEPYNDGGVGQNVPVEAAYALGAELVVAIVAVPLHPAYDDRDFTRSNLLQVHARSSAEIAFASAQRSQLRVQRPAGAELRTVVPTVDVVGAFEVNEGLLRLDMDYGHLRAQEALADLDDDVRARAMALTDRAVVARDRAWYLEEAWWHAPAGGGTGDLGALRAAKQEVAEALTARAALGLALPAGAEAWWEGDEHHRGDRPSELPSSW